MKNEMYFKCIDCWRVYSNSVVNSGKFNGCKCVCIRFKAKASTKWVRIKAFLSKYL